MNLPAIPLSEPVWESKDAQELRRFFESETGSKALQHVVFNQPELLDGANVNTALVRSGEVKGWIAGLRELVNLTVEQPKQDGPPETYPSLDDDSKWPEQKTITPAP